VVAFPFLERPMEWLASYYNNILRIYKKFTNQVI